MRFAVISVDFRWFADRCDMQNPSAKHMTFANGPVQNRIRPGFGPNRSDPSRPDPIGTDFCDRLGQFSVRFGTVLGLQVQNASANAIASAHASAHASAYENANGLANVSANARANTSSNTSAKMRLDSFRFA